MEINYNIRMVEVVNCYGLQYEERQRQNRVVIVSKLNNISRFRWSNLSCFNVVFVGLCYLVHDMEAKYH